jgi:hypothetical protein
MLPLTKHVLPTNLYHPCSDPSLISGFEDAAVHTGVYEIHAPSNAVVADEVMAYEDVTAREALTAFKTYEAVVENELDTAFKTYEAVCAVTTYEAVVENELDTAFKTYEDVTAREALTAFKTYEADIAFAILPLK